MNSFAGMVHNEDTTENIEQIPISLYVVSIFLDLVLRDFLFYIINKNKLSLSDLPNGKNWLNLSYQTIIINTNSWVHSKLNILNKN